VIVGCGNIGFETAKLLTEDNSILLIDRYRPEYLTELIEENENVFFAQGDALELSAMENHLDRAAKIFSRVDVLISTVGVNCQSSPIDDFYKFMKDFELNFFGNLVPIKAVLRKMMPERTGRIVILSSTSGVFAYKGLSAYPPGKWALTALCRALRSELRPHGISVDVFFPGTICNHYSKNTKSESGIYSNQVARRIVKSLRRRGSSDYFVPRYYRLVYPLERLFPNILNIRAGLVSKRKREKSFQSQHIQSVLITGASQGLGKELALLYSKTAKSLYLVARNYKSLLQIKSEIMQTSTCEVHIASLDIADPRAVADFADGIENVDMLINNAGSAVVGRVEDIPIDSYKHNFAVNFFGAVLMIAKFLNKKKKPLKIMNILSTTAIAGRQGQSCYSATKAALWAFTRALRRTMGNELHVIEVLPSTFSSNFSKNSIRIRHEQSPESSKDNPKHRRTLTVRQLTSRKVAEAIHRAERQGKEIILIPFKSRLFLILNASCPWLFQKLFG